MALTRCVASVVLATFAAGCSLQPVYKQPELPVSAAYPTGESYKALPGGPGSTTLPATDIGWRNFLPDPRLQRIVDLALQNNRDLRISVLNIELVQAEYRLQRSALFPQVTATASQTRTSNFLFNRTIDSADLSASWVLDFFGRLRSLSDAAREQYLASAYARQAFEILLVSQVADQYLTLLAFDDELAVTQATLQTAEASYNIVKLQFDNGTVAELDLRLSQTIVEQARANYASQVRLRAQAENALVLLVGQPLPDDLPPVVKLGAQQILADIPAGVPSDLLQRRPDILQAEAQLRAENANIGAARAAFFPSISLTGTFGSESATLGGLFAAGTRAWTFAPSLVAPIFNAGANQASLDIAKVQKDIGIATYQKTIQTAFREVADGLAARGTYDDQLAAQQRNTDAELRRLELANMLYTNGIDSYLNVLTAQTDLYNAQIALVVARVNRLTSLVNLYTSLGGGWIQRTGDEPRPANAGTGLAPAPSAAR